MRVARQLFVKSRVLGCAVPGSYRIHVPSCSFVINTSPVHVSISYPARYYCFKSPYSLDQLYPNKLSFAELKSPSAVDRFGKPSDGQSEGEVFSGYIPLNEVKITHMRSSGPGGQHANKVNTKVEIRFKLESANWIPEKVKEKLKVQERNRINKAGEFVMSSEKTRKTTLNQADCLEKIRSAIRLAAVEPEEPTAEELALKEKRAKAANERRLEDKRRNSLKARYKRGEI